MSRAIAYDGPDYPTKARIQRTSRGSGAMKQHRQPQKPCERHPGAELKERSERICCAECLKERDKRSNHKRDHRDTVPLLAEVWK